MNRLDRRTFLTASAALAAGVTLNRFGFAAQPVTDWSKLVTGNTQFGMELYGELKAEAGNLFLSPFSISTALGMYVRGDAWPGYPEKHDWVLQAVVGGKYPVVQREPGEFIPRRWR